MVLLLFLTPVRGEPLREQAKKLAEEGRWFEACCLYDELLGKDRNQPELRRAYRDCLRHFRQQRRLEDTMLQSLLAKLSPAEAGDLYEHILGFVVRYYADRERLDPTELFQQGVKELREALTKRALLQRHSVSPADVASFRGTLESWEGEKATSKSVAGRFARRIVIAASQQGLPPGVVAMELACGAANSLDEYSLYLAPGRVSRE